MKVSFFSYYLLISLIFSSFGQLRAIAAEQLTVRLGPFQTSIKVKDIEEFAKTGELPSELGPYAPLLTPPLKQLLTGRLQLDPKMSDRIVTQLLDSPEAQKILKQLQVAIPDSNIDTIENTLSLAIKQANQLNLISFLKAYPERNITIDLTSALEIALQLNTANIQSQILSPILDQQLKVENGLQWYSQINPASYGTETVHKQTLNLEDSQRNRKIITDIYYSEHTWGPLIVMSHGFAANRNFLQYLAIHLASHGLTVVSLEHPGSNITALDNIDGTIDSVLPPSEFKDRPLDVSFVLDELAKINQKDAKLKDKFNTNQVTAIGHSFGGYTVLALAGAEVNPKQLHDYCEQLSPLERAPGDWLQCAASNLPNQPLQLKDDRISQIIALNPIIGNLFSQDALSQISIPVLMLASSKDAITPTLNHQIRPFQELMTEKYLLVAIGATHMSITDFDNLNSMMGQSTLVTETLGEKTEPLHQLIRGVSFAFIQQLTPQAKDYQSFLTPEYVQSFSNDNLDFRLTQDLPENLRYWLGMVNLGKN